MKSILIRALCSIIVGVLLLIYPLEVQGGLVMVIGLLFLAPGVYSVFSYIRNRNVETLRPSFPITSVASILLGTWMLADPMFFIQGLMYALGGLLMVASIGQLMSVWHSRGVCPVPLALYFMPVILLLSGLYVILNPQEAAELPFIILGVSMVIYSILELFRVAWVNYMIRKIEKENNEIVTVDSVENKSVNDNEI